MKHIGAILFAAALAGCGANGEPMRPTTSGSVSIGTNGLSAQSNVGLTNGSVSLGVSQGLTRR